VGLGLAAASCGGATASIGSPGRSPGEVHTRSAAVALARSLVAGAPLPSGATPAGRRPGPLLSGAPFAPSTPYVERTRFAVTREGPAGVVAALRAHPPRGERFSGDGTEGSLLGGGAVSRRWVTFDLRRRPPGVADATLSYTVAAASRGGTGIRIDVQVVWRPAKADDLLVPASDRVAVVSVTPASLARRAGGATAHRRVVTAPAAVARLRAAADALPVALGGEWSCPADVGPSHEVAFARSPWAAPDITFVQGPCNFVTVLRGHRAAGALAGDATFTRAYEAVLRARG